MAIAIILLSATGAIAAFVLYFISKKFEVKVDPRVAQILEILPGANCGGCGLPGCGGFADACVKSASIKHLSCPVLQAGEMKKIAAILGQEADETVPKIAVVRCNGTCEARPRTTIYDGAKSCVISSLLFGGETCCSFGCVGWGDCLDVCLFGAIRINPVTLLAEISEEKCTACGMCVKACPKNIIEMRKKGTTSHRIFVACVNKNKGSVARKACINACTGCLKCVKTCTFDAITVTDYLAYIDADRCTLCRKCVSECTTGAIQEQNYNEAL